MRAILATLISVILAIVAAIGVKQLMLWMQLDPLQAHVLGVAAFASTLLLCLVVFAHQAGDKVEW